MTSLSLLFRFLAWQTLSSWSPKAERSSMRQRIGLVVAFFVAAVICPRVSWTMDLSMFDDMARLDQRDYLKYLVKNTEQVLSEEGRPDLAKQVHELFSRNP